MIDAHRSIKSFEKTINGKKMTWLHLFYNENILNFWIKIHYNVFGSMIFFLKNWKTKNKNVETVLIQKFVVNVTKK